MKGVSTSMINGFVIFTSVFRIQLFPETDQQNWLIMYYVRNTWQKKARQLEKSTWYTHHGMITALIMKNYNFLDFDWFKTLIFR